MKKLSQINLKRPRLFKKMNDPYRMVLINDQTLEEVASLKLTKQSVYIGFSTLFVVVILVTVMILLFTPLKYYVPGYGNNQTRTQVLRLRRSIDSLTDMINAEHRQADNIRKIINGSFDGSPDTTVLDVSDIREDRSMVPRVQAVKEAANANMNARKRRR